MRRTSMLVSMATAILAACGLALGTTERPAGAAFAGRNGAIAFDGYRGGSTLERIFRVRPDGNGVGRLTDTPGLNVETSGMSA